MKGERERNPVQLEHARPTPLSEVYLGTSSGIREPLWKHWTRFPKVPKRILQWCLRIQPIAQGTGCLNPSSVGRVAHGYGMGRRSPTHTHTRKTHTRGMFYPYP